MNNPITVKIKSNIDITDEHKNEMKEKLIYVFIEQLRRSGMYKVTEEKDGNLWILRADLVLPKKYEAEPVNGWISVKDRLPEKDGRYVVWSDGELNICEYDVKSQTFGDTFYDYDEMYSKLLCWDDDINKFVTHWQPLPEPPKGE